MVGDKLQLSVMQKHHQEAPEDLASSQRGKRAQKPRQKTKTWKEERQRDTVDYLGTQKGNSPVH